MNGILEDQRAMIRDVLAGGMTKGPNPRTVALDLVGKVDTRGIRSGGKIGLTQTQVQWVRQYQADLVSDPAAALPRVLRDRRLDSLVRRARSDPQDGDRL